MPSKLRKAIGAVKDQTSISLAKVTNAANLEVTILKATTHDKNPIEERYMNEILNIVSSNKVYATTCAHCISKRIGKTRNWVVALKSLMIVLRIFQDGDPYFPREVFHAMKRGAKILNLSSFKDDSNSSPWDYTTFIRTFSLYLDERLDCFLTGKLQRRFTYHNRFHKKNQKNKLSNEPGIKDMKPMMVLDKIAHWQRLLDRAIGTWPVGLAKTDRLVQISLYAIVQESFDLYKDIYDGLVVVLDRFFHLPFLACASIFNACVKSYKQFDELSDFYSFCTSIGVGRSYEYPRVKKVSEELMETLQEFLKDHDYFSKNNGSKQFIFPPLKDPVGSSSSQHEAIERHLTHERSFEKGSEFGSRCTSLEDLMSATDAAMSPQRSIEKDMYLDQSNKDDAKTQYNDYVNVNGYGSTKSFPIDQSSRLSLDVVSFNELQQEVQENQINERKQQNTKSGSTNSSKDCWELVLAKTIVAPNETSPELANGFDPFVTLFDQASIPQQKYNPFLDDIETYAPIPTTSDSFINVFDEEPTFMATTQTFYAQDPMVSTLIDQKQNWYASTMPPTFSTKDENRTTLETPEEDDPFGPWPSENIDEQTLHLSMQEDALLQQKQLWLEQQKRIISKHMT
uniref:Clathrin assembly protein At1g05020 family n=1 Tax=Cajanus cajan TaxID=3821 RepID=A0A151RGR0_CAJCA|nr:Putative clathrin assembly protein At1g05020 family [Cajanus cajan]